MCDEKCKKLETCCDNCYNGFIEFRSKKVDNKNCDHHYPRGGDGRINPCEFCGKEKAIRVFELDGYYNKEAYLLGQKSNENGKNPFEPSTNSWYNWNRGKNENLLNTDNYEKKRT
jgi:hypothetical protein